MGFVATLANCLRLSFLPHRPVQTHPLPNQKSAASISSQKRWLMPTLRGYVYPVEKRNTAIYPLLSPFFLSRSIISAEIASMTNNNGEPRERERKDGFREGKKTEMPPQFAWDYVVNGTYLSRLGKVTSYRNVTWDSTPFEISIFLSLERRVCVYAIFLECERHGSEVG